MLEESRVPACGWGKGGRNLTYVRLPWDEWQAWAIAQGLAKDLAQFGRAVIREAYQHDWDEALKRECGWRDDGRAMLELARQFPEKARQRWSGLLDTDGGRAPH